MSSRHGNEGSEQGGAMAESCAACPLGELVERRTFLRDAAVRAAGILVALGARTSEARALPLRFLSPVAVRGDERGYPIPATDGATIDRNESVIIVRWQGTAYAFSLACPHQNTAVKWEQQDARFQCPKHHSKYRPDGSFIEGRATRGLDRFAVRRDGEQLMVDLDRLYQQDKDPAEWKAAFVQL